MIVLKSKVPKHLLKYFEETEARPVPCTVLDPFPRRRNHCPSRSTE